MLTYVVRITQGLSGDQRSPLQICCRNFVQSIFNFQVALSDFLLDMTSKSELLCNGRQVGADSDEIKGRLGRR